jgi:hypothetical protein
MRAWLTGRRQRVVLNGKCSNWADVLSGVPQGSVLGPLLFLIFINDLDMSATTASSISKFADDTKITRLVDGEVDRNNLQTALDGLVDWAERWGMQFNVKKCKVMHLGRRNPQYTYRMGGVELTKTEEERDLGVTTTCQLKPSAQCAKAARAAQAVLGQITRAFHYRNKKVFLNLYKTYVRPHLEFAVQAWSPWLQADIERLERVQQRAIRLISGLKGKTYEEKLEELGLTTLEERRHQADMAMVYKILTRKDDVEPGIWFTPADEGARETRNATGYLNVRVKHGRLDVRRNAFSVRVTEKWNSIPLEIKKRTTVGGFKAAYAVHRATRGR